MLFVCFFLVQFSLLKPNKLSQSSTAISDWPLTREEDFDGLLESLAKFKLETRYSMLESLSLVQPRDQVPCWGEIV